VDVAVRCSLGCIFLFSGIFFGVQKTVPDKIPEDFFFSCVFWRNFSQECVFGGVTGIRFFSFFFRFYTNFSQEFLWAGIPVGRNFYIYSGFLRNSGGFLFPPKAVWLRPATKEGSL
jgi:hypothetical protein